jgi:hypothetical protein
LARFLHSLKAGVPNVALALRPSAPLPSLQPRHSVAESNTCVDSPRLDLLANRLLALPPSVPLSPRVRGFTHTPTRKGRHL